MRRPLLRADAGYVDAWIVLPGVDGACYAGSVIVSTGGVKAGCAAAVSDEAGYVDTGFVGAMCMQGLCAHDMCVMSL